MSFLDPDISRSVTAKTRSRYQEAIAGFIGFLNKSNLVLHDLNEIDVAVILYKNWECLTRSQLDYLIAALLFFFPPLRKGGLEYTKTQ